jgi:DNA phosphorothioation-dependent restriction protein DptG
MTTNQSLTEDIMSDQVAVENKIHIQALHHPDPDFYDDSDEIKNMLELIEYYLTFQCKNWGDLYADAEDSGPFISKIHTILFDAKDDEIGRIRDEFNKSIKDMAYFVYTNHETNRWAKRIYDDTIANII